MKHTPARAALISAIFILAAAAGVAAQTREPESPPRQSAPPAQAAETTADEDFELDIAARHITEQDFHAATEVATEGAEPGGLNLRVGAVVGASEIDVHLRNVRGRVRFRASLEPVLRLLGARRGPLAPAP